MDRSSSKRLKGVGEIWGHKSGMTKTNILHTVTRVMVPLEVYFYELGLENAESASDILFGVVSHSQQETKTMFWGWGGGCFRNLACSVLTTTNIILRWRSTELSVGFCLHFFSKLI